MPGDLYRKYNARARRLHGDGSRRADKRERRVQRLMMCNARFSTLSAASLTASLKVG